MARKTKEDAEKTFHCLLDSATNLFSEQGVAATTLNDIAKNVGMTRGAVYWHFPNKDAVIMALWERNAGSMHAEFMQVMSKLDEQQPLACFVTQLKAVLRNVLTDSSLNQAMRIVTSSLEFTNESSPLQRFLQQRKAQIYDALRDALNQLQQQHLIRNDLALDLISNGLWAYITGLFHTHLEMGSSKIDIATQSDQLLDLWLQAILQPS